MSLSFETLNALRDLDERTPDYFRQEVWVHGDMTVRNHALAILRTGLKPREPLSSRILSTILRMVPGEGQNAG